MKPGMSIGQILARIFIGLYIFGFGYALLQKGLSGEGVVLHRQQMYYSPKEVEALGILMLVFASVMIVRLGISVLQQRGVLKKRKEMTPPPKNRRLP